MRPRAVPLPLLVLLVAAAPVRGQEVDGDRSVHEGVYTSAQAESGKTVFFNVCSACHSSSQFKGLVKAWTGRTAHDLFESIRTTMPFDSPGRLSPKEYADVLAYIFELNGLPPGGEALPGDETLKRIRIDPGAGSGAD